MEHTQGKWEVKHSVNVFSGRECVATCGGRQSNVDSEELFLENQANALLVAAAPDLLEACKQALEVKLPGNTTRKLLKAISTATQGAK